MWYLALVPILYFLSVIFLPEIQAYRKWKGGFWFKERTGFRFWIQARPSSVVLMDSVPGTKEALDVEYLQEDWRQNVKSPGLKIVN